MTEILSDTINNNLSVTIDQYKNYFDNEIINLEWNRW